MNTKGIIISGVILTIGIGALYIWLERKKKPEPELREEPKEEEEKPRTPELLLKKLVEEILEKDEWRNERDFLSILSKRYVFESPEVTWLDYLPICQEDLFECLNELGYLEEYEKGLEERYWR